MTRELGPDPIIGNILREQNGSGLETDVYKQQLVINRPFAPNDWA